MSRPASDTRFEWLTLISLSGPLIWSLHFGGVYGGQHVACETGLAGEMVIRSGIALATLAAIAALGLIFLLARRNMNTSQPASSDTTVFLRAVTIGLLGLSLFGVLATALAGVMLPVCPNLR
jgi:hypothetical protein